MPRSTDGRWTKECQICGTPFQQRRVSQITCSVACRAKLPRNTGGLQPKVGLPPLDCPTCGVNFTPVRDNQIACSPKCYRQTDAWKEAQRRYDRSPERRARKNELRRGSERVRVYNRKIQLARYGLTVEQHDEMLAAQNGLCAICGKPPNPNGVRAASRLHADHDHVTGKVRALLCNSCNNGIGRFRDDPALLHAAAEYIERHRRKEDS